MQRRRGHESRFKRLIVQILVLVAIIQIKTLKIEVEKDFMSTSFGRELFVPKVYPMGFKVSFNRCVDQKGN